MERGLNKLEDLNARVAVLEERIPQPLSKELQPLFEQMKKIEIQLAELRGAGTVKDAARIPNGQLRSAVRRWRTRVARSPDRSCFPSIKVRSRRDGGTVSRAATSLSSSTPGRTSPQLPSRLKMTNDRRATPLPRIFSDMAPTSATSRELLGHQRLMTTALYTRVSSRELRDVLDRCHPRSRQRATRRC